MCSALERAGFGVLTAKSGVDALAVWHAHRGKIDVLVSDVQMPGMDGATLARKMSQLDGRLRVLLVSGTCSGSGLRFDFLAKPFTPSELVARVGCALSTAAGG